MAAQKQTQCQKGGHERNDGGFAMSNLIALFSFLFVPLGQDLGLFCALALTLPAISF